jgi:hypothetical protein
MTVATYDPSVEDSLFALAERIEKSNLVPGAYRGKPVDIAIAMIYGHEMGLSPLTSLQRVVVIEGSPTLDAQGMTALTRKAGHSITGEVDDKKAVVTGVRQDNGDTMTVTWTIEMAMVAGLLRNDVWKKYTSDMLWARAVSQICRRLFGDVVLAVSYTPEEARQIQRDDAPSADEVRAAAHMEATGSAVSDVRPPPGQRARALPAAPPAPVNEGSGEIVDPQLLAQQHVVDTVRELGPERGADANAFLLEKFGKVSPQTDWLEVQSSLDHWLSQFPLAADEAPEEASDDTEPGAAPAPAAAPEPEPAGDPSESVPEPVAAEAPAEPKAAKPAPVSAELRDVPEDILQDCQMKIGTWSAEVVDQKLREWNCPVNGKLEAKRLRLLTVLAPLRAAGNPGVTVLF